MIKSVLTGILFVVLFVSNITKGEEVDLNRYDIYFGDLNNDSFDDYYFHAKDFMILLHGDVITPIVRLAPMSQKLLGVEIDIAQDYDESLDVPGFTAGALKTVSPSYTEEQIASLGLVKLVQNVDFLLGDFNGDSVKDVVFSTASGIRTFLGSVGQEATFTLASLSNHDANPGFVKNSTFARVSVRDTNGDGKDELVYSPVGQFESEEAYSGLTGAHIASLDSPVVHTAKLHGASSGTFRVDERGAATYNIPVSLPAGTAGVAPGFSLQYSSQNGSGLLGHGWSLSGLSAISRCQQTLSQDGVAKPITWSSEDRFCLNGQRLKEVSRSSTYREYLTEVDSYMRVRAYGIDEGNPTYFTVDAKDGSRSYYGQTSGARHTLIETGFNPWVNNWTVIKPAKVKSWAIERFEDNLGNAIWYEYDQEEGNDFRVSSVYYALGNGAEKSDARARVNFEYQARPDVSHGFLAGYGVAQSKRLAKITVQNAEDAVNNGQLTQIREYNLVYKKSSLSNTFVGSYLEAVQECVVSSECLPATYFNWEINRGVTFGSTAGELELVANKSNLESLVNLDIDADGDLDVVWLDLDETHDDYDIQLKYAINKGTYFSRGNFHTSGGEDCSESSNVVYDLCDPGNNNWKYKARIQPIDYNADGRQDLALFKDSQNSWSVLLSMPSYFSGSKLGWQLSSNAIPVTVTNDPNAAFVDLDSDGLLDILTYSAGHFLRRTGAVSSANAYSYIASNSKPVTWVWNGLEQEFATVRSLYSNIGNGDIENLHYINKVISANADFNGDGVADVIVVRQKLTEYYDHNLNSNGLHGQEDHYYAAVRNTNNLSQVEFHVVQYLGGKLVTSQDEEYQNFPTKLSYQSGTLWPNLIDIQIADFNQDGLHEIIVERDSGGAKDDSGHYELYMNTGGEFAAPIVAVANVSNIDEASIQFMDRDGDNYADLVLSKKSGSYKLFNYYAWQPSKLKFSSQWKYAGLDASNNPADSFMYFDTNGDGHVDAVKYKDRKLSIALNKASGLDKVVTSITNGLGGETSIHYESLLHSNNYESIGDDATSSSERLEPDYCETQIPIAGAGCAHEPYPKIITSYSFDEDTFYKEINDPFASLKSAAGSGNQYTVSLAAQDAYPILEYLTSMYVVTSIDGSAPAGSESAAGEVDTQAESTINYYYKNARIQSGGRGYLGFEAVTTLDAQSGVRTTTEYRQDFPFVGYPLKTKRYLTLDDTEEVLSSKTNYWRLHDWGTEKQTAYGENAQIVDLRPFIKRSEEITYSFKTSFDELKANNSLLQLVNVQNKYDEFGNVIEISTSTSSGGQTHTKTIFSDYDNDNNYATQGAGGDLTLQNGVTMSFAQMGRLTGTKVITKRNSKPATTRESWFSYYGSGVHAGMLETETIEPEDTANRVTTTHVYDTFGNETGVLTVAKNQQYNFDGTDASEASQTREARVAYDDTGRYVDLTYGISAEPTRNRSGFTYITEEVVSRNIYGVPTHTRSGISDLEITIDHDSLGRETYREDNINGGETGSWSSVEYLQCGSALKCPAGTSFVVRKSSASGAVGWEYYDVLGRAIRTATQGFDGAQGTSKVSYLDTEYDIFGRVLRTSEPYVENTSALYWTKQVRDLLGRVTSIYHPAMAGQDANRSRSIYDGFTTTYINGLSQRRTEGYNAFGELTTVLDALSGRIEYAYTNAGELEYMYARDAFNQLITTTHLQYDYLGRKIAMSDPDKGEWEYKYNAFGELVWQKDAKGQVVTQNYDGLGRMLTRVDYKADGAVENSTHWYYDGETDTDGGATAGQLIENAALQVSAVIMRKASATAAGCSSAETVQCNYPRYDRFGRSQSVAATYVIDGDRQTYNTSTLYDSLGRVEVQTDVLDGVVVSNNSSYNRYTSDDTILSGTQNHYDDYGFLYKITDLQTDDTLHKIEAVNARGQVTKEFRGNGVTSQYEYDDATGRMGKQTGNVANLFSVQYNEYNWDKIGNLMSQARQYRALELPTSQTPDYDSRNYCYDKLNRLVHYGSTSTAITAWQSSQSYCVSPSATPGKVSYDNFGNIETKEGVGTYSYGGANGGAHAVTAIVNGSTAESFHYDANGNLIDDYINDVQGRHFDYTTFDKPTLITKGDHTTEFKYGFDRSRYWRQDTDTNNVVTTTQYLGGVERITRSDKPSEIQWKRYLGRSAIITITTDPTLNQLSGSDGYEELYVYRDQLGSVDTITDAVGTVKQRLSFNPWGERRDADTWVTYDMDELVGNSSALVASFSQYTTRGFTGHEMVDEVGIIHMNGRIYDPRLARFLQADPIIQAATHSQSLNRYSYVWNNPLNATDPSGYQVHWNEVRQGVKQVVAVVVAVVASAYCTDHCGRAAYAAIMGMVGAGSAILNGVGGSDVLVAAFTSAAMAGASYGLEFAERVAVASVMGGMASMLQGGDFGHGMLAAGIGALSGAPIFESVEPIIRVGVSAILGGTASRVTGGKFANGAITAAISAAVSAGTKKIAEGSMDGATHEYVVESEVTFQGYGSRGLVPTIPVDAVQLEVTVDFEAGRALKLHNMATEKLIAVESSHEARLYNAKVKLNERLEFVDEMAGTAGSLTGSDQGGKIVDWVDDKTGGHGQKAVNTAHEALTGARSDAYNEYNETVEASNKTYNNDKKYWEQFLME